jgi:hypothetical protein
MMRLQCNNPTGEWPPYGGSYREASTNPTGEWPPYGGSCREAITNPTGEWPPYGGSCREANAGSDTLGALAATLYTTGLRTTTGCTDRTAYVRRTYVRRTDCYCGQARLLLGYALSYCLPSVVNSHSPLATIWETVASLK